MVQGATVPRGCRPDPGTARPQAGEYDGGTMVPSGRIFAIAYSRADFRLSVDTVEKVANFRNGEILVDNNNERRKEVLFL